VLGFLAINICAGQAFIAKQLGHSKKEFFEPYAIWIDRMDNSIQMDLLEKSFQRLPNSCQEKVQNI